MSDIFIFPSMADSFGLVVAEAMYCGAAVITSEAGIGYSLTNGKEAIILSPLNHYTLFNALKLIASDKFLKDKLADEGMKRVRNLRWSQYMNSLDKVLKEQLAF
jgi:UDP-glucose:(heptosyl)LPS alpha-1,3-glucosyltransferase